MTSRAPAKIAFGGAAALVLVTACGRLGFESNGWWDPGWSVRVALDIDGTTVGDGAALEDFPLMVRLDASRFDYQDARPDGGDLRFVDDGDDLLPYEVERWDPGAASFLWLRVPRIAASPAANRVWMYYGNPSAGSGAQPAAVWADTFRAVWHCSDAPDGNSVELADSAESGIVATATAPAIPSPAGGVVAAALEFDGVDDSFTAPPHPALATGDTLSVQYWTAARNVPDVDERVLQLINSWDIKYNGDLLRPQLTLLGQGYAANAAALFVTPTDETWVHLAVTLDRGDTRWYVDGVLVDNLADSIAAGASPPEGGEFLIGVSGFPGTPAVIAGRLDEIRISSMVHDERWVAAEVRSMTDQMIVFGNPEHITPIGPAAAP